jgi:hypothetical protein
MLGRPRRSARQERLLPGRSQIIAVYDWPAGWPSASERERRPRRLFLFSWAQQLRNCARVDQKAAATAQGEPKRPLELGHNLPAGAGHSAAIAQHGNNNAFGVQFGRNASIDAAQTGNGQAGVVLQYGW